MCSTMLVETANIIETWLPINGSFQIEYVEQCDQYTAESLMEL